MNHLIPSWDLEAVEGALLVRKQQMLAASAWTLNAIAVVLILSSFALFLYVQYTTQQVKQETEKEIPFTPIPWYSATRNVRTEEYGKQVTPVETGYGVSGIATGGSGGTFSSVAPW